MTGDERVRACAQCNKNVYNISQLTRDEAEALILEKEGRLCVRYFQRKDGTILLKDCTVGVAQKRKRKLIAAGAAALLGGGAFVAYKVTRPDEGRAQEIEMWQGQIAAPPVEMSTTKENPPPHPGEPEWQEIQGDVAIEAPDVVLGELR